jgi:hypothetical protein
MIRGQCTNTRKEGIIELGKKDAETIAFTRPRQRGQGNQSISHFNLTANVFEVSSFREAKEWLTQISSLQLRSQNDFAFLKSR